MNEPKQLTLLEETKPEMGKRQVVYVPPPPDFIDKYARSVCKALGEKRGEDHTDSEFVRGFAAFIRAIVQMKAHELNKGVDHAA